jgi:hypothetical protein
MDIYTTDLVFTIFTNPNEVRIFDNMNTIINTIDLYNERNQINQINQITYEQDEDEDEDEQRQRYRQLITNFMRQNTLLQERRQELRQERRQELLNRREEELMNIAMEQSLNHYKTQEKKTNIKLNIESKKSTINLIHEKCAICTSEFEIDQNITYLECNHVLHTECIKEWVMYKAECPICRGKIDVETET